MNSVPYFLPFRFFFTSIQLVYERNAFIQLKFDYFKNIIERLIDSSTSFKIFR